MDCWNERQAAIDASAASGSRQHTTYVPECKSNGDFDPVQCYKVIF